jgi:nucleoside-diphosphate-sugar epimerase
MGKTILITGVNGEIGHGLVKRLSAEDYKIIALDISLPDENITSKVFKFIEGDILDTALLEKLFREYKFDTVFHLAAMLSTSAERDPVKAHHVNTDGSINLLSMAEKYARKNEKSIMFIFPSSIAVYGMPNLEIKTKAGKVSEEEYNLPATMYGCNKLYIEMLGNYYARYYEKHKKTDRSYLDFRCVRFPGIISADTLPTGGTSDFGPEMLHAAAQNKPYECFVREDSKIPFMVMPDAVKALVQLAKVPKSKIKTHVYNVGSFTISAKEIESYANRSLHSQPKAGPPLADFKVTYKPHQKRQAIVDSWPEDVDDSKARNDWGWSVDFDKEAAFNEYLIPSIKSRYTD